MVAAMYSDEVTVLPVPSPRSNPLASIAARLRLNMKGGFVAVVNIPATGYPDARHPTVEIEQGPNAVIVSQLEQTMRNEVIPGLAPGAPSLVALIQCLQMHVDWILESMEESARQKQEESEKFARLASLDEADSTAVYAAKKTESGIVIHAGSNVINERKSKFLAHVAKIRSSSQVREVLDTLLQNKHIATATHSCIYAYRVTENGVVHSDCDDDGEQGASKKVLFLLESMKVDGYIAVITRWFGGILLGPDRFKLICECAADALREHGAAG